MAKKDVVDALQVAHVQACADFSREKRDSSKKRDDKKAAVEVEATKANEPVQAAEKSLPPGYVRKPKQRAATAHDLVLESNEYTDAKIAELMALLKVDEDDVGPWAKGLLSQALRASSRLQVQNRDLESRVTCLEAEAMGKYTEEEDSYDVAAALGTALGRC